MPWQTWLANPGKVVQGPPAIQLTLQVRGGGTFRFHTGQIPAQVSFYIQPKRRDKQRVPPEQTTLLRATNASG